MGEPVPGMSDSELIGYCRIHCETERALFNDTQINRMIELAGYPKEFVAAVSPGWHSVHHEMKTLCDIAQKKLNYKTHTPRFSDSSQYDEVCTTCGARDVTMGEDELSARPCTKPKVTA